MVAALLTLPRSMSRAQKAERVDEVIRELVGAGRGQSWSRAGLGGRRAATAAQQSGRQQR